MFTNHCEAIRINRKYQVSEESVSQGLFTDAADYPKPSSVNRTFNFIDIFAGIGGFRLGLEAIGGHCLFSSELDKQCQVTYSNWFGDTPFGDINEICISDIPNHDLLAAGFPCQPFSLAGVSKKNSMGREHGFNEVNRGNLFFVLADMIKQKRPAVILLENVKNLLSHDCGRTWKTIYDALVALNYDIRCQVIDASGWVPQHRERVFIVGFNRNIFTRSIDFSFPASPQKGITVRTILDQQADEKYILTDKLWQYLQDYAAKHRSKGNGFGYSIVNLDGITRTLSARYYKDGSEILIPRGENLNPRRITPREAARLMGFPDHLDIVVSDVQAYKQFGNAVVPPLIESIGRNIMQALNDYEKRWQ